MGSARASNKNRGFRTAKSAPQILLQFASTANFIFVLATGACAAERRFRDDAY